MRYADAGSTPISAWRVEKIPSRQSDVPVRLLKATAHPCRGMVPNAHGPAVHINTDPAVILHRDDLPVAVIGRITITGQRRLDKVRPVAWRVQLAPLAIHAHREPESSKPSDKSGRRCFRCNARKMPSGCACANHKWRTGIRLDTVSFAAEAVTYAPRTSPRTCPACGVRATRAEDQRPLRRTL